MDEITFDFGPAIDAGQSWIDHDKSSYETTYDFAFDLGEQIEKALVAGAVKDRKAMALKLNESWGITAKGAETRCRRAHVIAMANPAGVVKYDKWAGEAATVTGLVAWIDNGYKAPAPPTPPAKVRWNANKVGEALAKDALKAAGNDKAKAKAALEAALKAL